MAQVHAISLHPFKDGVYTLLAQHFSDSLVKRFHLNFESELYTKDLKNIWAQKKDGVLVLEVRFQKADGTYVYICDLWSIWSKSYTEHHLLRYITDKIKDKKINATDWKEVNGRISDEITSGKHQTNEIEIK